MKCLRIYSTADGESHFDEVEIPTTALKVHPNAAAFEASEQNAASGLRFTNIPAGARAYGAGARDDSAAEWISRIRNERRR
jgi:hypothetical protein